MKWVRVLREKKIWPEIQRRQLAYAASVDSPDRLAYQLDLFNEQWSAIKRQVPFYYELSRSHHLPKTFSSLEEVTELLPVMRRNNVQSEGKRLWNHSQSPEWWRITGGSTAQPVQIPGWKSENAVTSPDMWLGRSWYGIRPSDRLFLIWGHSQLLGSGLRGIINRYRRELNDSLLGYYRFSAYNMQSAEMEEAAKALLRFRPAYLLGYSVALDHFARSNQILAEQLEHLRLKAVVGTAEGFPWPDSASIIGDVLRAPVAMEYGSVETGVVAHTVPEGGYRVFWRTYFVEASEPSPSGGRIVRLTSLFHRCFPLVRYEIGDEIELKNDRAGLGVDHFTRVIGRCNDYLLLEDGTRVHSELITHSVRTCKEITGYQAVQSGKLIRLQVTVTSELRNSVRENIRSRLKIIHPSLGTIPIEEVPALKQTVAGKRSIVVRES